MVTAMGYATLIVAVLLFFFSSHTSKVESARITSLIIPKWVQNGTEDQVILDCDYDFDPELDQNLTIKWYFNERTELIYEWIPRLDFRYVSGKLQGKFNWDFSIFSLSKNAAYKKYRALAIKTPTTELTGRYICQVVSALGDDSEEESMIVYAPPEGIEFSVSPLRSEDTIQLEYKVNRVYPLPEIQIYQTCRSSGKKHDHNNKDKDQEGWSEQEEKNNPKGTTSKQQQQQQQQQPDTLDKETSNIDNNAIDDDEDDHILYSERSINDKRSDINGIQNLQEAPVLAERSVIRTVASTGAQSEDRSSKQSLDDDTNGSINNNDEDASNTKAKDEANEPLQKRKASNNKWITRLGPGQITKPTLVDGKVLIHESTVAASGNTNLLTSGNSNDEPSSLHSDLEEEKEEEEQQLQQPQGQDEEEQVTSNALNEAISQEEQTTTWLPRVHHHKHHQHRHRQTHHHSLHLHPKSQVSLEEESLSPHPPLEEEGERDADGGEETDRPEDEEEDPVRLRRVVKVKHSHASNSNSGSERGGMHQWNNGKERRGYRGGGRWRDGEEEEGEEASEREGSFHSGQDNEEKQFSASDALNDAHQVHLSPSCDTPFCPHPQLDKRKGQGRQLTTRAEEEEAETHELGVFSDDPPDDKAQSQVSAVPWANGPSTSSNSDGTLTLQFVQFLDVKQVTRNHEFICTLNEPVIFQLQTSIPGTDFVVRKSIEYPLLLKQSRSTQKQQRQRRKFYL